MRMRLAGVALAATLVASAAFADAHAAIGTRLTSDRRHIVPGRRSSRTEQSTRHVLARHQPAGHRHPRDERAFEHSHAVTRGCIRAGADDIRRLFDAAAVGTPGAIIYEPLLIASVGDAVYLEVNADIYHRLRTPPLDAARALAAQAGVAAQIDWRAAQAVVAAHAGVATPVTAGPVP